MEITAVVKGAWEAFATKITVFLPKLIGAMIIFLAGIVVTFSLKLVGGLLIYALLFNPASTVLQFSENIRKVIIVSPLVGMLATVSGFFVSRFFVRSFRVLFFY